MEEFNKPPEGVQVTNDVPREHEYNSACPNVDGKEFNKTSGSAFGTGKKKSSNSRILSLSASMLAVVTAVSGGLFSSTTARADIIDVYATDTEITWRANVERADGSLTIVAYNDFTHRETDLIEGVNEGTFSELQENMQYKIVIYGKAAFGKKVLSERKIRTKKSEDMPVSQRWSIPYELTCTLDGCFRFTTDCALTTITVETEI